MNWIWQVLKCVDTVLLISPETSANSVVGPIYCEGKHKLSFLGRKIKMPTQVSANVAQNCNAYYKLIYLNNNLFKYWP